MQTFILTLFFVLLSVLGLGLGVLAGRAPIKGSCGGLACMKGAGCGACARSRNEGRDQ